MPCDIKINSVVEDSGLKSFIVKGSAALCGTFRINLTVSCGSEIFSGVADIQPSGLWEGIVAGRSCGDQPITTTARCHLNQFCYDSVAPPEVVSVHSENKEIIQTPEPQPCSGCKKRGALQVDKIKPSSEATAPCVECSKNQFLEKLGTCIFCIKSALLGTMAGWILYILLFFFNPAKYILIFTVILASVFTLLLYTHAIAYLIKNTNSKTKDITNKITFKRTSISDESPPDKNKNPFYLWFKR